MKDKMIIAGGTGFLGRLLTSHFNSVYDIIILTRGVNKIQNGVQYVHWDGKTMGAWIRVLEKAKVLVNLNGKSVDCRYTETNRREIHDTRIESTAILGLALNQCTNPPSVWLNASSATIYRYSEDIEMDEYEGELGKGFSEDICLKWEESFTSASARNIRKITLRTGIVLGNEGGPLKPLTMLAKLGFGGKQGNGRQYCSWLHAEDFCRAVEFLINDMGASGIYNITAPAPVTNSVFMKALSSSVRASIAIRMPKWLLELGAVLIRTETELILKSRRVVPMRLKELGFAFRYPTIETACDNLLKS